jgi:hypothetical protein
MAAQNPKLVSVELGLNEVIGAQSGVALVGAPPLPVLDPPTFAAQYRQVLDRIAEEGVKHVLLVGLSSTPFALPAFRSGAEIATAPNVAALLVGFNVAVQPDCATPPGSANIIFVPTKLGLTVQAGLAAKALGQAPVPFSCAGGPPTTVDFVLTAAEQAVVTAVVAQMNATMQAEAESRGWAFFNLDALSAVPGIRPVFNVATLFSSTTPFGPFFSNDGLHVNAAGQALIAQAAAQALNARYDLGIPLP